MLVLILACLPEIDNDTTVNASDPVQAIYIVSKDPFAEVEEFVNVTTTQYHLDLRRYAMGMRQALDAYLNDRPEVQAIFMGTRRTDPHSDTLGHFSPTDKGWPQFMRVNPVIDWGYADIWAVSSYDYNDMIYDADYRQFIRHLQIPYCCLYDQGFTSLGGTSDTKPNPALAIDAEGKKFRPAYELVRGDEERKGRNK